MSINIEMFLNETKIASDDPMLNDLEKIETTDTAFYYADTDHTQKINIHIKAGCLLPGEDYVEWDENDRAQPVSGYVLCYNDSGDYAARVEDCYMPCVPHDGLEGGYGMPGSDGYGLAACDGPDAYTIDNDGNVILLVNWIW